MEGNEEMQKVKFSSRIFTVHPIRGNLICGEGPKTEFGIELMRNCLILQSHFLCKTKVNQETFVPAIECLENVEKSCKPKIFLFSLLLSLQN